MFAQEVRRQTSGEIIPDMTPRDDTAELINNGMVKNDSVQKLLPELTVSAADSTFPTTSTTPRRSRKPTLTSAPSIRSNYLGTGCTREETEEILQQLMGTAKRRRSRALSSHSIDLGSSSKIAATSSDMEAPATISSKEQTEPADADADMPLPCESVHDIQKYRNPVHLLWL